MRRFAYGADREFAVLKEILEGDVCYVVNNCRLPNGCNRDVCRVGFEKDNDKHAYYLLIDYGITCSRSEGGIFLTQFKQFLTNGEYVFLDYNDLKEFWANLRFLFD